MPRKIIKNNGICQIYGCDKKTAENRKYCGMHRQRFIRHCQYNLPSPEEHLLDRIRKDENGCWNYIGCTNSTGYGHIRKNGKVQKAHRVSFEYFIGPIPDGLFICHKCDNPACVNPDHLYAGTQKDNVRDMFSRGRAASQRKYVQEGVGNDG